MWQVVQLSVVETWLTVLPVAVVPLWQVEQTVAAVNTEWSTFVPSQVVVDLWQVSQLAEVCKWLPLLPVATVPLWQLEQPEATDTLMWNLAGNQLG